MSAHRGIADVHDAPQGLFDKAIRVWTASCLAWQVGHCAESAPELSVRVVYQLYKDFAWVPTFAVGKDVEACVEPGLMEQPKAALERYFDSSMVDLITAETQCVADKPGTLRNLEFAPLFGSAGAGAVNLRMKGGADNTAQVQFDDPSSGEKIKLEYALAQKAAGRSATSRMSRRAHPRAAADQPELQVKRWTGMPWHALVC